MSGMVRVAVFHDVHGDAHWFDHPDDQPPIYSPEDVYEIPAEQRARWQAAIDAYNEMQAEVRELAERKIEHAKDGQQ